MFTNKKENEKALQFILNPSIVFEEKTKNQYYVAFKTIEKDPLYFDLFELNSDDPRLLKNINALTAYCHYVLTELPKHHFRFKLISKLLDTHIAPQLKLTEKILRGEIIHFPPQNFRVMTVNIFDYLKQKDKNSSRAWALSSSGEVIFISDIQLTIFENKKVVFHDVNIISELVDATSTTTFDDLTNLIAYRPETIVLHEALTLISLRIDMPPDKKEPTVDDHEKYILQTVDQVMAYAKKDVDKIITELYDHRKTLEKKISKEINDEKSSEFKTEIEISKSKIKNNNFGCYVKGFSKNDAILILTVDRIFTKIAEEKISQIINQNINLLIHLKKLTLYQVPQPDQRILFLITGGQASGKSTLLFLCPQNEPYGILRNSNKFSIDLLKNKILSHSGISNFPQELFSLMTHHETSFIVHYKIVKELTVLAKQSQAPHAVFEQVLIPQDKINLGLINNGRIHAIIVSTDIEKCIENSFIRGKLTGRFSSIQSMLNMHKESIAQLPLRMLDCIDKPVLIEIVDNNAVSPSFNIIVQIHCDKKTMFIYNAELLKRFIRKIALNPKATSSIDLYNHQLEKEMTIEKYFEKIMSQYQIIYVEKKPELTLSSAKLR